MTRQVTVSVFPVRSDAEIASARLAADGIRSIVVADDEGGLNPGFFRTYGVRLVVDAGDVDDACTSLAIERLMIREPLALAIAAHASTSLPNEACGFMLFDGDVPVFVCPLTNVAASDHRFTIDPHEHHGAWLFALSRGWTIGGVFHSHPRTEAFPSPSDISGGADPDWIHVILGPVVRARPALRAFRLAGGAVSELSVSVIQ